MMRDVAVVVTEMCDAIRKVNLLIGAMSPAEFAEDMRTHEAVYGVIVKFGEGAAILQRDHREIMNRYPAFPARSAVELRNRLVHGYWDVNQDILFEIATRDLPATEPVLRMILADFPPPADF
jgi:uncharacterized protein with HEPN domain